MLPAGSLFHTIIIERETKTRTPSRGTVSAWTEIATTRAEVVKASAADFLTGFGTAQQGTAIFRIRWREGLTTADRIVFGGKAYAIKEIADIGRRVGLEIRAVASS
jgi:SPP1 family predicted phage head-tail adaptor